MSGFGAGFGAIGGAVSSIFGGIGDLASAKGYNEAAALEGKAAELAGQNAVIAATSGRIQLAQTQRQVAQVMGGQQSDVAGAGFAAKGSARWLMRDSAAQGALATGLVQNQTAINVNGYKIQQYALEAQQQMDEAAAQAAQAGAMGDFLGGGLKLLGGLAGMI